MGTSALDLALARALSGRLRGHGCADGCSSAAHTFPPPFAQCPPLLGSRSHGGVSPGVLEILFGAKQARVALGEIRLELGKEVSQVGATRHIALHLEQARCGFRSAHEACSVRPFLAKFGFPSGGAA